MLLKIIPLSNRNVILISKSITTKELYKNIQKIVRTKERTRETLNSIYENINIYIKQIWQNRCKQFIEWEKSNSISRTKKRYKTKNHTNLQKALYLDNTEEKTDKANRYTKSIMQHYLKYETNILTSNFNIISTLMESWHVSLNLCSIE